MNLYELIMKRRTIRNFKAQEVPESIIEELVDAANQAPTGGNIQPLSIIVVEESAARAELAEIVGGQPWVANAPTSLIFCVDFHRVKRWASAFDVEFRGDESLLSFLIAYADIMCAAQNVVVLADTYDVANGRLPPPQYRHSSLGQVIAPNEDRHRGPQECDRQPGKGQTDESGDH